MSSSCDCGEKASVGASVKFHCKTCSSVIQKIEITKPLKVTAIAAILAYGGSQFIDYAITDNRYPLSIEHEIVEACTSSYMSQVSSRAFTKKKNICFCALEDSMNEISYVRYKIDEKSFMKSFKDNVVACKK